MTWEHWAHFSFPFLTQFSLSEFFWIRVLLKQSSLVMTFVLYDSNNYNHNFCRFSFLPPFFPPPAFFRHPFLPLTFFFPPFFLSTRLFLSSVPSTRLFLPSLHSFPPPAFFCHPFLSKQVQFVAIFVHSFQLLFRDCDYPRGFVYWIGSHAVLFWFLFWDFFKKTYLTSSSRRDSQVSKFPVCFGQTDTLIGLINSKSNGGTNGVVKNGRSSGMNGRSSVKNGRSSGMNGSATNGPTRLNNTSNGLGKECPSGDHDTDNNSKSRKLD